ncbi:MAG: UbiX family flavin prenyltransferase [Gammaproteobacteria bacterium]|nr:UbiX family flavin prenyltransferase [Gammaproteobacteria bacterium]
MHAQPKTITLAITGASGSAYALKLLTELLRAGCRVYLMISKAGRMVLAEEAKLQLSSKPGQIRAELARHCGLDLETSASTGELHVFALEDWFAPVASGSNPADAMVVCPCTTGTLAEIALGTSRTLIERAADVTLKEGRPLILVVRETPFSTLHLQNMLRLSRAGATIMPANPGFYLQPRGLEDIIDFMVARILDHLRVDHQLLPRWGNERLEC